MAVCATTPTLPGANRWPMDTRELSARWSKCAGWFGRIISAGKREQSFTGFFRALNLQV